MKKILILFVLFSCMSVYGEEVINNRYEKVIQEQKTSNVASIDWGPYMREMEQNIKSNWKYNKDNISYSKNTVVKFIINRNGEWSNLKILKSSGSKEVDKAALEAVQQTHFKPLPKEFNGETVPIVFTFDINVINVVHNVTQGTSDICKTKFCKFMQKY